MSNNYTAQFINLVNDVLLEENVFFNDIKEERKRSYPNIQKKILEHYNIQYELNTNNAKDLFEEHIKEYILQNKSFFIMNMDILKNISKQLHIDYLLTDKKNEKYIIYYSLVTALNYHGIFREERIVNFSNISFWKELIKKCYLLYLLSPSGFRVHDLKENYIKEIPNFVSSIKYFESTANIKIQCIDFEIIFTKNQETKIISLIEKKLRQIDILNFIDYILVQNRNNGSIPFNYIINLALKNVHNSNFKKKDEKSFKSMIELFINFLNLYKLRSFNMWEYIHIDETNIGDILKKQTLYSSLYSLNYPLKGLTVINYINNLLGNEILNDEFQNSFNFTKSELILFLNNIEQLSIQSNIIKIDTKVSKEIEHIVNFFSIDCQAINLNYSHPIDLSKKKIFLSIIQY